LARNRNIALSWFLTTKNDSGKKDWDKRPKLDLVPLSNDNNDAGQANTHFLSHSDIHKDTRTHILSFCHKYTQIHFNSLSFSHTYTHSHSLSHTRTLSFSLSLSLSLTHTHTHTNTHIGTHTHSLALSLAHTQKSGCLQQTYLLILFRSQKTKKSSYLKLFLIVSNLLVTFWVP